LLENTARGAIIFASGLENETISRHFAPQEKGTLIEYVLDSVWTVADDLIVVFDHEPLLSTIEAISPFGVKVLTSTSSNDSLRRICDAFRLQKAEHCLLATERYPLLKPNVVLSLYENAQGHDLAIPKWRDGRTEPLLAVYRKNSFIRIASNLKLNSRAIIRDQIAAIADKLFAIKYVAIEEELKAIDPDLDSFHEVKDEKSLQKARLKASIRSRKIMKPAA
jgi:molybdopterin-guanine dinucleotide biosynthesis protein A